MARVLIADVERGGFVLVEALAAGDPHLVAGQLIDQAHGEVAISEHLEKLIRRERAAANPDQPRHLLQGDVRSRGWRKINLGGERNRSLEVAAFLALGDSGPQRIGIARRPALMRRGEKLVLLRNLQVVGGNRADRPGYHYAASEREDRRRG